MGKHVERKRLIIATTCCIVVCVIAVVAMSYTQYMSYTKEYNLKINAICNEIKRQYPNVSSDELMSIVNSDSESQENFFRKYGIDLYKDSVILKNNTYYRRYLIINIATVVTIALCIFAYLYSVNRKREQVISSISQYIVDINKGNYQFDMETSAEGEFSILESEVYKTTIMLKEAADNSRLDKERLKDSLSDISHQLKTPLTSLIINLENLERPDINEESRQRLIGNAKRDTNRISQMVQQLLTLSELDANVIEFKKEKGVLIDIVHEAMDNVEALADLMEINLVEENTKDSNANITCDIYWEIQAITNILKNAIEHAKSTVTISYLNCELYKEIIIQNDGEAISEIDRKNIFERFYSGEKSAKDSVGIGLSLANAVVKNDGGYIVVESDEEKTDGGVKFIVRYV